MRVVCLSDTHGMHEQVDVPDGDILIHAGDFLRYGGIHEIQSFDEWLSNLPHPYKIVIAGNHDTCFERQAVLSEMQIRNAIYLRDSGVTIEGITFYGSPWQPFFNNWAFNLPRNGSALEDKWDLIPEKLDVLVTHGPPHGILDIPEPLREIRLCGCEKLIEAITIKQPKVHVFGHIHGGYGAGTHADTKFVNASICTETYKPTNAPIVIESN